MVEEQWDVLGATTFVTYLTGQAVRCVTSEDRTRDVSHVTSVFTALLQFPSASIAYEVNDQEDMTYLILQNLV